MNGFIPEIARRNLQWPELLKRYGLVPGGLLVGVQSAAASDMTGALMVFPLAGTVLGLVLGIVFCIFVAGRKRKRWAVWLSLPVFGVLGFFLPLLLLGAVMSQYQDKIVCSFGNYDRYRGGMGVIPVPATFSESDLKKFYDLISDRDNAVLSSHEFAAALVHQANGLDQVYLNVYPSLDDMSEYVKVDDEMQRLMGLVLKQHEEDK